MGREPERGARAAELAAVAFMVASLIVAGAALAAPSNAPSPTRPVAVRPVGTVRCVNSFDPACGPLHWVPAPSANQPTTTSLSPASARGVVGRPLSFEGRAADPDASIVCHWILYGDETAALIPAIAMQRQYGRWSTPAKRAGSYSATFTHIYAKPGTYRVQFGARSGNGCSNDYSPYGGENVSTATVTITAH